MLIYKITNILNGKIYVGQTVQLLRKRWALHKHHSQTKRAPLYDAIRKYGLDNFKLEVLETIPDDSPKSVLDDRERYWTEILKSMSPNGYNLTSGGDGKFFLSEETKVRISQSKLGHEVSEETRAKISESLIGRPGIRAGAILSEETRAKISKAQIGKIHSDVTKQRMSESHANGTYNSKKVQCIETGIVYVSTGAAAKALNLQQSSVSAVCRGTRKRTGGLTFKFV